MADQPTLLLAKLRKEKHLSQTELAKLLGVSQQQVSLWEKGSVLPSFPALKKMCDVLNCTMDELTGSTFKISYECTALINELKRDIAEFGENKIYYVFAKNVCGKIIVTNYDFFFPEDKEELLAQLRPGEGLFVMQAKDLLAHLIEQNSIF